MKGMNAMKILTAIREFFMRLFRDRDFVDYVNGPDT